MTDDDKALVERLREGVLYGDARLHNPKGHDPLRMEAADRIEALSAENERLQFLCDLNAVPAGIIEDRARMEERAAIVAWLRHDFVRDWDQLWRDQLIDAIEAGEHLK